MRNTMARLLLCLGIAVAIFGLGTMAVGAFTQSAMHPFNLTMLEALAEMPIAAGFFMVPIGALIAMCSHDLLPYPPYTGAGYQWNKNARPLGSF